MIDFLYACALPALFVLALIVAYALICVWAKWRGWEDRSEW